MTMVPEMKTCPTCGKKYSWNPDVGKMFCPYCKEKTKPGSGVSGGIGKVELKSPGTGKLKF